MYIGFEYYQSLSVRFTAKTCGYMVNAIQYAFMHTKMVWTRYISDVRQVSYAQTFSLGIEEMKRVANLTEIVQCY